MKQPCGGDLLIEIRYLIECVEQVFRRDVGVLLVQRLDRGCQRGRYHSPRGKLCRFHIMEDYTGCSLGTALLVVQQLQERLGQTDFDCARG